ALLAAATMALPETPHGERNWDYRYAWVRDSTFALWGLYTLGFDREANDFFYFIHDACSEGNELQVMYRVGGEREIEEESLPHLSGYEGAFPVRLGNAAYKQRQHDVWGAVLDYVYLHARAREELTAACGAAAGGAQAAGGTRRRALGGTRSRHLGGARGTPALRDEQGHVLGRPRSGSAPGAHVRRAGVCREVADAPPTDYRGGG